MAAGIQGLVVAGTGNGTLHASLMPALAKARASGVALCLVSRCAEGQLVGEGQALASAPPGLNAFKARISLLLDLL